MPLFRITVNKGRSEAALRAIADGVHQALVDTYDVPPQDRFQIIEECEPGRIIYDASYLGVHRTDALVVVQIVASAWRDTATKQALYRAMADRLAANPGVRREDLQVIMVPNDKPDWSFGNGLASYVPVAG